MRPLAEVEARLETLSCTGVDEGAADELLAIAEETLEHWVVARGDTPTTTEREGFRLLALHRQGCRGLPSFNACRETCREIAYHYNLLKLAAGAGQASRHAGMMVLLANHLFLFVAGKMQVEQLGEFCCSSRPLHQEAG